MFYYAAGYYLVIKAIFFFSLVRAQIKSDLLRDHWLFLGMVYTAAVAFLSYAFLMSWMDFPWADWQRALAARLGISPWQAFLGETLVLSSLYFKLMAKFDEGVIFWTLLLLGILVVWF